MNNHSKKKSRSFCRYLKSKYIICVSSPFGFTSPFFTAYIVFVYLRIVIVIYWKVFSFFWWSHTCDLHVYYNAHHYSCLYAKFKWPWTQCEWIVASMWKYQSVAQKINYIPLLDSFSIQTLFDWQILINCKLEFSAKHFKTPSSDAR